MDNNLPRLELSSRVTVALDELAKAQVHVNVVSNMIVNQFPELFDPSIRNIKPLEACDAHAVHMRYYLCKYYDMWLQE